MSDTALHFEPVGALKRALDRARVYAYPEARCDSPPPDRPNAARRIGGEPLVPKPTTSSFSLCGPGRAATNAATPPVSNADANS